MYIPAILTGLLGFLGAFAAWDRARHQPDDVPMYSLVGHKKLSKREVYGAAVGALLMGIFFLVGGLLIN